MARKKKDNTISVNEYLEKTGKLKTVDQYLKDQEKKKKQQVALEKKQKEEKSQRLTKHWQQDSYTGDGQKSYEKYRQKQIIDSNGGITGGGLKALEEENKKPLNKVVHENTKQWRNLSQNATYAGAPQLAYAGKMIKDTPVSKKQEDTYGQYAREMKYNKFLDQMREEQDRNKKGQPMQNIRMQKSGDELLDAYNKELRKKYGSDLGTEKDLSPLEQYQQMPGSKKSGWLSKAKGNDVSNLLSYSTAKQYINTHPYDLKAAQANMNKWESATKEAVSTVDEMHNEAHRQVGEKFSQKPFHAMGDVFDFVNGLDKQNEQTINNLESTETERRQNVLDRAEDFLRDGIDLDLPEYVDDPNVMRRALYDNIMPDTYDERTANMTPEDKAELDKRLDIVLQRASTEENYVPEEYEKEYQKYLNDPDMLEAEIFARYSKDRYDEAEAEVKFVEQYQHLMNNYYRPQAPNYIAENDQGGFAYKTQAEIERGIQTDDVHRIYSFINGGKEWQSWAAGNKDPRITNEYNYAGLMNDQEIAIFNDYYNRGEYESASQFLQALNDIGALSKRYNDYEQISIRETARQMPILSSIAAQGMMFTNTFTSIPREIAGVLGDKYVKDPNSGWYTGARTNEAIQNEIVDMLGPQAGKVYQQSMQSIRNVVNGLFTGMFGLSGIPQTVASLSMFASQIYQESTWKYLNETNDFDKARGLAALDAMMETAEELLPYETMLNGAGGRPVLSFLMNGLSEGGEELTGATIGEKIRGAITGRDSLQKRADEIYVNGGYYKDGKWVALDKTDKQKAINEADLQAYREWNDEIKESVLGGTFGGMFGATYGGITYKAEQYATGKRINSENNTEEGKTGAERIVELGAGMDRNTDSYKLASKLQELMKENKKPSNFQLGKLAQNIYAETSEKVRPIAQGTVAREARHQLMDQGMDYAKAEAAGNAIAKYVTEGGKSLTAEEQTALADSDKTVKLLKSFISDPLQGMSLMASQIADMQPQQSIRQEVAELASGKGRQRYSASVEDVAAAVQKAKAATASEVQQAKGKSTGAANEIIHDGVIGAISGIRNGQAVITVSGEERTVDLGEIKAVNPTAAAVITFAQKNKGLITDDYATRVLQGIDKNKKVDAGKYLDDAMKIRLAALSLNTQPKTTGIDAETAKGLYKAAQDEFEAAEKERIAKAKPSAKPGEGSATIDGAEYGTDEFQQKIKDLGLSKQVRNQVGALSEISVRAGFRVNYINDTKNPDIYGWYDNNTGTITINLAGENEKGVSHHLLVTAGHEMTHWLEANSGEGYAQLRQFVVAKMRERGENIEQRLVSTIDNFNATMRESAERQAKADGRELTDEEISNLQTMDLNGAMAEIVANACDQVLSSQAVADELAKVNPSLYNKVKTFVKDFVARVRNAIGGMDQSRSHESALLMKDVDQIAKIWLGARDEALGNNTEKEISEGTKGQQQYALNQYNQHQIDNWKGGKIVVYDGFNSLQNFVNKSLQVVPNQKMYNKKMYFGTIGPVLAEFILNKTGIETEGLNVALAADEVRKINNSHGNPIEEPKRGQVPITAKEIEESIQIISEPDDIQYTGDYRGHDSITFYKNINGFATELTYVVENHNELRIETLYKNKNNRSLALYGYASSAQPPLTSKTTQGTAPTGRVPQSSIKVKLSTRQQNTDTSNWKNYFMRDGQMIQRDGNRNETVLTGLDREYIEAYNKGDFGRMEEILADKIRENGAIPFKAPNRYNDKDHSFIAKKIKEGDMYSVQRAAQEMAEFVPENAVLIPMPNHYGQVNDDTDTMVLAKEISEITGRPVVSALAGVERMSRYEDKKRPKSQQMKAEDLGFRQVAEIPEGTVPYFVDNVIASGLTAKAAHQAMGNNGVTLAYAKSTQSATGNLLKRANVTFYDQPGGKKYGNWLIPLSERIDMSKSGYEGTKFSTKQRDEEYKKAVASGNIELQKELVYEAADQAMPDTQARYDDGELITFYHGTHADFNEFDTSISGGAHGTAEGYGIYLTDRKEISDKYGERVIAGYLNVKRLAKYNKVTIKKEELANLIKATCEKEASAMLEEDDSYSMEDALKDTWISNYVYTPEYKTINDAFNAVADIIMKQESSDMSIIQEVMAGNAIRDYKAAMEFYHDILTPVTGFDGFWAEWYNSDGELMGNIVLAFDSSQIKSADPVTYDDYGNVIPLSERFNENKKDIRFSTRQQQDPEQQRLSEAWLKEHDTVQDLRKQLQKLKPEMDAWADKITEAQKNGTMDDVLAKYMEWEKGYTKIRDELFEAERRDKAANQAYDDYIEQRDVAEEQEQIKKSGLSEPEFRRKQAVDQFGYTTDFREAGYLLPNGKMLNFSGEKGRHYGSRGEDHRGIGIIYASSKYQGGEAMMQFMRDGNIRVMAETPGVDLISTKEPTAEQYAAIRNMARRFAREEYFNVDFTDERGYNADSIEYDGRVNPEKIVNDIKTFYRTGQAPQQSVVSQFHYSVKQNEAYMKAVNDGNMDEAQRMVDKAARQAGYIIRAYHGTGRGDRVGTVFLPERATSGPMAFFTDNRQIAENYARNKKDTSIDYDEEFGDYHNQFRVKTKDGKTIPISKLWNKLPTRERLRIREAAKHITWDDAMENIIYDKDAQNGNGGFQEWKLREDKGNAIETLIYAWLDGGDLYDREEDFLTVLELAGIKDVIWYNPDYREEKVYDTYLKIQNPFKTGSMFTNEFVDRLLAWWDEQDQDEYLKESMGADLWDKNNRTVEEWAERARDNIKNNLTTVWTSIPDAVSDFLRSEGYDGIQDQGGKGGGEVHTVWIPFSSEQIKSAEPVTYDNEGNVIPLNERFDQKKKDIRYSTKQLDREYLKAYENNDERRMREIIERAAYQAGYTDKAYHGTELFGFTKFDLDASQGAIFVSYGTKLASSYTQTNKIKAIEERKGIPTNFYTLSNKDLIKFAKQLLTDKYTEYISIEPLNDENGKNNQDEFIVKRRDKIWDKVKEFKARRFELYNWLNSALNQDGEYFGIYELFTKPGNQLVIDAEHRAWNEIPFDTREMKVDAFGNEYYEDDESMDPEPMATTREIAAWAKKHGYDSVRINNVLDNGGRNYYVGYEDSEGDIGIFFNPNDVKSADTITTTDKDWIPILPSERFNDSETDLRYSIAQGDMNVNRWMLGLNPDMLYTEQEKNLLKQYKGLRMDLDIQNHAIEEYTKQLRKLQAKANPSAYDREEMRKLRILIENREKRRDKFQDEIIRVTSSEGYAGMMYRSQNLMNALINNRTADDVRKTVDAISKELERVKAEMAERDEKLKELANEEGVAVARTYFAKANIKQAASELKKNLNSKMKTDDIVSMLAVAALKMRKGENVTEDVVDLATLLVSRQKSDFDSYVLSELRGRTIILSDAQMKEIRGQHRTLRDIQKELAGTGIRVKTGKGSTLDKVWDELCDRLPMLNRDINDLDMMDDLLRVVRSEMNIARESQYGSMEQVSGMVLESVLDLVDKAENIDSTTKEMIDYISSLAGEAKEQSQLIKDLTAAVERLKERTAQARGAVSVLDRDVRKAIDYFNALTEQSEAAIWRSERAKLIAQMKEEKTEALLQEQDKWKERIAKEKAFRENVQNNMAIRKQIHTVVNRMGNRLFAETDQKNIPEEAKPLVRQVMWMLAVHDGIYRKVTMYDKQKLVDIEQRLLKMAAANGKFDPDTDLDWLVVKAPDPADNDYSLRDKIWQDLADIESGLLEYRNAKGNREITQHDIREALTKIQEAVSEIYSVIQRRSEAFIAGKRYELKELAEQMESEMASSKFKGERTGKVGRALDAIEKGVGYGNLTPEYFFKNLKNGVMRLLHKGFHDAENRAGLEAKKAMEAVARFAQETGFSTWDGQEKHQVKVKNGQTVEMTTEQIMALYATWLRESNQMRPEDTAHLLNGGFVLAQGDRNKGVYGRQKSDTRPIRMSKETLAMLGDYLTDAQKQWVEDIVGYMSGPLAEIGNETSMQTWGIKKFTEQFYFPIKAWGGVLNKSSDAGINNKNDNRAMRQSFTKRLKANASNAIEIGDFTPTAMKHIVGMITFNTVGPAVENMNKVLNQQLQYGDVTYGEDGEILEDNRYKRNVRAAFQDAYGEKALKYLETFMGDVNGGMTMRMDRTIKERLLSVFRKNAVAGSLSVTFQQPLSYIRAAMMIHPKYLAGALSPKYWKGSYAEMLKHSGVAVIKDMGRFDMNQGQSMIDYISPETKGNTYEKISEWLTKAPELADRMTWTRMWSAVKMEQHALHPEMDIDSDEFLDMVGERFNEVMRKTQVYDSMMVKSQNMRSKHYGIKAMTSFMAEPTLSLNVLADAVRNAKEKGGKTVLAKAGATFLLSAVCQAIIKGFMGTGRTPDKKKTAEENFLNKFQAALIGEADPLNLVPGFSDVVELLKTGELADDAMSVIGKFKTIRETATKAMQGKGNGAWRDLEDTVGQVAQLFTNIPAKNLMRDTRAMYNWISGEPYADRESSAPVKKYQAEANRFKGDNLIGAINVWLGDAGFKDSNAAYYDRIYEARKAGNDKEAEELTEYLTLAKNVKPETIETQINTRTKKDDTLSESERADQLIENGSTSADDYVIKQLKEGKIDRKEAEKLLKKQDPTKDADDIWWRVDRAIYKQETGESVSGNSYYYRLTDAIYSNKSDEIKKAVKDLTDHGISKERIEEKLKDWKKEYLETKGDQKRKLENALTMAYKAIGMTADQALEIIHGWKPAKTSNKK